MVYERVAKLQEAAPEEKIPPKELGIVLAPDANMAVSGEATFHSTESRTQLWVIPTNEEVIVARQCVNLLKS